LFTYWSTLSALSLGAWILWTRDLSLAPIMFVLAYPALVAVASREIRKWRDLLNPLALLLLLAAIRYSLPAMLLTFNPDPDIETFRLMGLEAADWQMGHVLALVGMLGVSAGWLLTPDRRRASRPLRLRLPHRTSHPAIVGMALGLVALVLFVSFNSPLEVAIEEGSFRHASIEVGTGVYYFLSLSLISASVLLSNYLLTAGAYGWRVSLAPAMFTALSFFVLGGRVHSTVSIFAVLLLLWYIRQDRRRWAYPNVSRFIKWAIIVVIVALWFGNLGQLYRGGSGLGAFSESLSLQTFTDYTESTIYEDIGQLHALAGATKIGPGHMEINTFIGAISWPLPDLLDLRQSSAGAFIVEETLGFFDPHHPWGFHASLMGDAYLNFGVFGLLLIIVAFGVLVKLVYVRFRSGHLRASAYVLATTYSLRIFLESIEKWGELVPVLVYLFVIIFAARMVYGEDLRGSWAEQPQYPALVRGLGSPTR
jgi:oligosaccharide repeat unit polymerase